MGEPMEFKVDRRKVGQRWLIAIPLSLALWAIFSFAFRAAPIEGFELFPWLLLGFIAIELVVLLLVTAHRFVISGRSIQQFGILSKRTIEFAGEPTVVVPTVMLGMRTYAVHSRNRRAGFGDVEANARFLDLLKSGFSNGQRHVLPRSATYRGFRWMHYAGLALMLVPLFFFAVVIVGAGGLDDPRGLILLASVCTPILVVGLPFALIVASSRIVREGDELFRIGLLGRRSPGWKIENIEHRRLHRFVSGDGRARFRVPILFGDDKKLVYDVFAISSADYEFVD
jgi:hypothetical protein